MNNKEHITYENVMEANIVVHTEMSKIYNNEPHFRPENIARVKSILQSLQRETKAQRWLDLGCGTGFIINMAKDLVSEIHGVDITEAMINQVSMVGDCDIILHKEDTGNFMYKKEYFDVVTGYAFLHHLYDMRPSFRTAYNSLRKGGKFYCDLDPNYYFWDEIHKLDKNIDYSKIIKREIEMVVYKDDDVQKKNGITKGVFDTAEYGKNIVGGMKEDSIYKELINTGFTTVNVFYHWFVGQAQSINDSEYDMETRFYNANIIDQMLQKTLPISRPLFKYIGFIATK